LPNHGIHLEAAVLAAVAVEAQHEAFPVAEAAILDLLLDAATEETLENTGTQSCLISGIFQINKT
jgi:hypothetical protein